MHMATTDKDESVAEKSESAGQPGTIKKTGFVRIVNAAGYSLNGLKWAFNGEAAFRQECFMAIVTLPIAIFLMPIGRIERMLIVCVTCLVLIVELLNSAVEAVVDRVGLEAHPLSGQAKDIGSAAVLVTILLWGYVWAEVIISVL